MQRFRDLYAATLYAAITAAQTTLQLTKSSGAGGFPALAAGDYLYLLIQSGATKEIVRVSAVTIGATYDTVTVLRDYTIEEAGAFAFPAGATVTMVHAAVGMEYLSQAKEDVDALRLRPVNSSTVTPSMDEYFSSSPKETKQIVISSNVPGWRLNINIAGGAGDGFILLYRSSTGFAWPTIYFQGVAANVRGAVPTGKSALLCVTKVPAAAPITANAVVSMEWRAPA